MGGIRSKQLQCTPHLILLDPPFYDTQLLPLFAKQAVAWMKAHHVFEYSGSAEEKSEFVAPADEQLLEYAARGTCSSEGTLEAVRGLWPDALQVPNLASGDPTTDQRFSPSLLQVLNLASEWVGSYAPHTLGKTNRVSFGLLQQQDLQVRAGSAKRLGVR